ncbi:MAG: ribonuclease P protein component [Pseudomonadota bacterium]
MTHDQAAGCAPPPFLRFEVLTKRSDFLRAARGRRVVTPGFVLQGWNRKDGAPARVGFTCSKKVGNAVARNRAKRRLREIARLGLCDHGAAGWDYVLIGRAGHTSSRGFAEMQDDLRRALADLHGSKPGQRR